MLIILPISMYTCIYRIKSDLCGDIIIKTHKVLSSLLIQMIGSVSILVSLHSFFSHLLNLPLTFLALSYYTPFLPLYNSSR